MIVKSRLRNQIDNLVLYTIFDSPVVDNFSFEFEADVPFRFHNCSVSVVGFGNIDGEVVPIDLDFFLKPNTSELELNDFQESNGLKYSVGGDVTGTFLNNAKMIKSNAGDQEGHKQFSQIYSVKSENRLIGNSIPNGCDQIKVYFSCAIEYLKRDFKNPEPMTFELLQQNS